MFVPIVPYHAGGDAAAFAGHPKEYEFALATYLGAGTAACYRGATLYGEGAAGAEMRAALIRWVTFYKAHRLTLIEPVVHLRRPDMQSWDGFVHVRPSGATEVAVAMLFNPTDRPLSPTVVLPLYYAGVGDAATVLLSVDEGAPRAFAVGRAHDVHVPLTIEAKGVSTVVVTRVVNAYQWKNWVNW